MFSYLACPNAWLYIHFVKMFLRWIRGTYINDDSHCSCSSSYDSESDCCTYLRVRFTDVFHMTVRVVAVLI